MRLQHVVISPAVILAAVTLAAGSGQAQTTWYVDDDACPGPGSGTPADPFCKIQDGINAAVRGDMVLVLPGTYLENIALVDKGITLRSDGDGNPATHDISPEATIIDGQTLGSVVTFASTSELEDSLLEGFTITNGKAELGGGICCNSNTAPVISHNVITSNTSAYGGSWLLLGGGIYCSGSSVHITGNTIADNNCSGIGGGIAVTAGSSVRIAGNTVARNEAVAGECAGIYCESSACEIVGNLIVDNFAFNKPLDCYGGGISCVDSQALITNNIIAANVAAGSEGPGYGGGLSCLSSIVTLENNTIFMNSSDYMGGGIFTERSEITVSSSILWANEAVRGDQISGNPEVSYCDVQDGWPGIGNIDSDPLFVDSDGPDDDSGTWEDNDLRLAAGSPCIDAGAPGTDRCTDKDYFGNPRVLDALGTHEPRIDMGAHEFDHVHLQVTGNATPGAALTFTTSGTPAFHVWLFVGTQPGALCLGHYGGLFFDFSSPWFQFFWGRIPPSGSFDVTVAVPATMPVPTQLVFQELGRYAGNWGTTSNPVEIVIE
ncbi:MAG: right-handed parallel beta-helix repeat-containing protein [Planctomycetota bacterium]